MRKLACTFTVVRLPGLHGEGGSKLQHSGDEFFASFKPCPDSMEDLQIQRNSTKEERWLQII